MKKSKANKAILKAVEKGYTIDKKGNVYGIKNKNKLYLYNNRDGYYSFGIRMNKKRITIQVHRFQAYMKFGKKALEEGIHVRHLNNISTDNSWDNIAIGSQSDNMMDIPKKQRRKNASHPKYNHKQILLDRKNGMKYTEIMKKYNIASKSTVSYIINKSIIQE